MDSRKKLYIIHGYLVFTKLGSLIIQSFVSDNIDPIIELIFFGLFISAIILEIVFYQKYRKDNYINKKDNRFAEVLEIIKDNNSCLQVMYMIYHKNCEVINQLIDKYDLKIKPNYDPYTNKLTLSIYYGISGNGFSHIIIGYKSEPYLLSKNK